MKKFLLQSVLFLVIVATVLQAWPLYLLFTKEYEKRVVGNEIYISLNKSKLKVKPRKLVMGDSVGNQLFNNKNWNDSLYSIACNQAIGLPGQYALLNNFYESGNTVDTVLFIYQPFSFRNNLDQPYTFHYFIKPFYTEEYKPLWNDDVLKAVQEIPYHWLAHYPGTLTSNWAPDYPPINDDTTEFISPISASYLHKLIDLANVHGSKFILVPTPVSEGRRWRVDRLEKSDIDQYGLSDFFGDYFDRLVFLPDSVFSDGIHLRKPQPYTDIYAKQFGF